MHPYCMSRASTPHNTSATSMTFTLGLLVVWQPHNSVMRYVLFALASASYLIVLRSGPVSTNKGTGDSFLGRSTEVLGNFYWVTHAHTLLIAAIFISGKTANQQRGFALRASIRIHLEFIQLQLKLVELKQDMRTDTQ